MSGVEIATQYATMAAVPSLVVLIGFFLKGAMQLWRAREE